MNRQQAIELVKQTFEAPFEHGRYIRFLRELLNGFDDEGARVNQGARIPEKFQEYVEKLERVGKYVSGGSEILLFIVYLKRETSIERARTMQRNSIAWYLSQGNKDAALVAFVSPNSVDWRFSLVKMDYRFEEQDGKTKVKEEFTPARRWSFLVGANEKSHTAQSKFVPILEDDENNPTLAQLEEAFNIEPVTKEFFKTFREIFEEAEAAIDRPWSAEQKRLYTQRFFNRLLFIVFLERKGWLSFGGRAGLSDSEIRTETTGRDATAGLDTVGRTPTYSTSGVRKDYLRALFEDYYQNQKDKNANFHRSRLNTLFFMGLNYPGGDKRSDPAYKPILSLIGDVPYLNGGLFEQEEDDKDGPTFPDAVIAKVLKDLVYQFNFTVTESTPLDVEVAVDPEMLGRIFEELVTGRHESGSYYTPKPVVQFMCREALKGYLVGRNSIPPYAESAEAIARFVDQNDAKSIRNPMQVLDALRAVKVCDPACGSGAYLLGMLHELLEQYTAIFAGHQKDAPTLYQTKLDIIQNNLYGVDKDDFAVNIARLRLWLSLIVDYEGATPPPLPNLDFKIECGDSLTAPDPSGGLQPDMFRQQQVQEFLRLKNEFMGLHAGSAAKRKKAQEIEKLKEEIKEWAHPRAAKFISPDDSFDWQVEFAEVFAPELATPTPSVPAGHLPQIPRSSAEFGGGQGGGFDIVLANPPYVRADAQFKHIEDEEERQRQIAEWQNFRKHLKDSKIYKTLHEKWDLYIPFLERAYQLLRENGQMVFIIPDAYNAAKYAGKSHEFFLQNTVVERIDFCSEINLFDAGVNNTILHFAKITPTETSQSVRVRRWGKSKDEFETNAENLPTNFQKVFGTSLFRYNLNSIQSNHSGFIVLENIFYVSKGMVIHAEEDEFQGEFAAEDLLSTKKDKLHPKRFVFGKDVFKWSIRNLRFLEWNTDRAPVKFSRPTFPAFQDAKEKLLSVRTPGAEPKTIYDEDSIYFDASSVGFVPWSLLKGVVNKSINKTAKYHHQDPLGDREQREDISKKFNLKYVLAIMNSSFAREWLKGKRRSKMHIYPDDWKQLPIAPIPLEEQKEFVKLVDQILGEYEKQGYPLPETSAEKVREWEGQLDEMVGRLYESA